MADADPELLDRAAIAVGLSAAFFLSRWIAALLYEVSAVNAPTYLGATAVLLGSAFLACAIPAVRAAKTDPLLALRRE